MAAPAIPASPTPGDRVWIIVLISGFLGLMVDGMDLMFLSYSLPSLIEEFQISRVQAGSLASYSLLGMAIGGVFGGWAADRYGRVRVVVWTIVLFSVATAALGLTQSYWQFAIVRFISALGLGAEYVVCNTLMAEYVPTERRTTVLGTLQAGWSVGTSLPRCWPAPSSRCMAGVRSLPRRWCPYCWRSSSGERFLSRRAGRAGSAKPAPKSARASGKRYLPARSNARIFVLWTLTSCFLQFGYYGVNNWLPTYVVSELKFDFTKMTGYLVGTYVAMIFGKIVAGYLADIVGRRWMYVFGGLSTAVFLPVIVLAQTPENIIVLLTIFGFLYGVPYGVNATYMTESFDTHVRGTAVGGAYNIGRIGAALGPALIGLIATEYSIGLGFIVMGAAYCLTGIIPALFIPEKMYDPQGAGRPDLAVARS